VFEAMGSCSVVNPYVCLVFPPPKRILMIYSVDVANYVATMVLPFAADAPAVTNQSNASITLLRT